MPYYAKIACDLARDARMLEAGPIARMLYVQMVLYSRENLTDGYVDRRLLQVVAVDIPNPKGLMSRLEQVGAVEPWDQGWRIPPHVWATWNPTRVEVDEMLAVKADAGTLGNHKRWHVAKGVRSQDCRYCIAPSDRNGNRTVHPNPSPETETETETEERGEGIGEGTNPNPPPADAGATTIRSRPKVKPPPRTPLPDPWTLTPDLRAAGHEANPAADVEREHAQFVDHHRANGDRQADWHAAWRKWCRNAHTPKPAVNGARPHPEYFTADPTPVDHAKALAALKAARGAV